MSSLKETQELPAFESSAEIVAKDPHGYYSHGRGVVKMRQAGKEKVIERLAHLIATRKVAASVVQRNFRRLMQDLNE